MDHRELAAELFLSDCNCAQAVLEAFSDVTGLLYGYDDPGENDVNKKAHYQLVQDLAGQFREKIGSIICREILNNPPSDPNPTPRTAEFYKTRPCAHMVMTAAGILDDYIAEHPVMEQQL